MTLLWFMTCKSTGFIDHSISKQRTTKHYMFVYIKKDISFLKLNWVLCVHTSMIDDLLKNLSKLPRFGMGNDIPGTKRFDGLALDSLVKSLSKVARRPPRSLIFEVARDGVVLLVLASPSNLSKVAGGSCGRAISEVVASSRDGDALVLGNASSSALPLAVVETLSKVACGSWGGAISELARDGVHAVLVVLGNASPGPSPLVLVEKLSKVACGSLGGAISEAAREGGVVLLVLAIASPSASPLAVVEKLSKVACGGSWGGTVPEVARDGDVLLVLASPSASPLAVVEKLSKVEGGGPSWRAVFEVARDE